VGINHAGILLLRSDGDHRKQEGKKERRIELGWIRGDFSNSLIFDKYSGIIGL
jgi:hypothetical protein